MSKYIKKPVIIEAVQWNGNNTEEIINFTKLCTLTQGDNLIIPTLEGDMKASIGDFIIKGVHGEFYPCKPDIFKKTYDRVRDIDTEDSKFNNQEEVDKLQEKVYSVSNSAFPLDAFFNDIRDNKNPNYNKCSAYEDLEKIIDTFIELIERGNHE